jgi:hypothetical protein
MGYPPATGCFVPGTRTPIDGLDPVTHQPIDPTPKTGLASVLPQCSGRQTDQAVYCSCRCANVNGQTNDGANYCTCPDGFQCTQLVTSISDVLDTGLTGGYCIKNNTQYDTNLVGPGCAECDPGSGNCGPVSK